MWTQDDVRIFTVPINASVFILFPYAGGVGSGFDRAVSVGRKEFEGKRLYG